MDTRISIYKLEVFSEVAASRSVTRAAAKLGVAQPVVTAHLRSLESRLGVKLVEREGRGIALTQAGQIVHRWADQVVTDTRHVSTLLDALGREGAEGLSVATGINGASNGIAHAVVRFQAEHPDTRLELRVLPTDQAIVAVLARDTDLAVVACSPRIQVDRALRVQRLASDELILVASPSLVRSALGAVAQKRPGRPDELPSVTADELGAIPFVCTPGGTFRRSLIDGEMQERGVGERQLAMEVRSETAFHAAVRDGIGFALLSRRTTLDMLNQGQLTEVRMPLGGVALDINLIARHDLPSRPLHRLFREAVQAELTKNVLA